MKVLLRACLVVALSGVSARAQQAAGEVEPEPPPPELDPGEVVVHGVKRAEPTRFSVDAEQAARVPGGQGDPLKVVESLPGVTRPTLGSGAIVIWGASPRESRVYVDGVEIPALYHAGGIRSVIHPALVREVSLLPGAYGPEYSRALGGLVRVTTRELPTEGIHGRISADLLDASALVSAAPDPRARFGASFRYGYFDRVLPALGAPDDVFEFMPVPRYQDYQARADWKLPGPARLSAVLLGARDRLRRALQTSDPDVAGAETRASGFERIYFDFAHAFEDGEWVRVTPHYGFDHSQTALSFGSAPAHIDVETTHYGVRAAQHLPLGQKLALSFGADILGKRADLFRSGSHTLPAREGDVTTFGQPPADEVTADSWSTQQLDLGGFVSADLALGALTLSPGVRFDLWLFETSRTTPRAGLTPAVGGTRLIGTVEPRLSAALAFSRAFALRASAGTFHQPPDAEDLSAVFGTPELSLSRATHTSAGFDVALDELRIETTAFYKWLEDLTVRSRRPNPALTRALVQDGEGRAYGAQLLLRHGGWQGFSGYLSYTLSRSERRYLGDSAYRLLDYDQTHALVLVAQKELGWFTLGARLRFLTGLPRTPVVGAYFDANQDRFQPLFGEQNSDRLPDFFELDLRVDRSFSIGETELSVYLEVLNATARENAEEIVYSHDYQQKDVLRGMPPIAMLGASLEF